MFGEAFILLILFSASDNGRLARMVTEALGENKCTYIIVLPSGLSILSTETTFLSLAI